MELGFSFYIKNATKKRAFRELFDFAPQTFFGTLDKKTKYIVEDDFCVDIIDDIEYDAYKTDFCLSVIVEKDYKTSWEGYNRYHLLRNIGFSHFDAWRYFATLNKTYYKWDFSLQTKEDFLYSVKEYKQKRRNETARYMSHQDSLPLSRELNFFPEVYNLYNEIRELYNNHSLSYKIDRHGYTPIKWEHSRENGLTPIEFTLRDFSYRELNDKGKKAEEVLTTRLQFVRKQIEVLMTGYKLIIDPKCHDRENGVYLYSETKNSLFPFHLSKMERKIKDLCISL